MPRTKKDDHNDLRALLAQIPENDETLIILKGHLIVEQLLLKYIEALSPNPNPVLKLDRMTFHVRARIARTLREESSIAESYLWDPIDHLNAARNALAHDLDQDKLNKKLDVLIQRYESRITSWRPKEYRQGNRSVRARFAIVAIIQFLVGSIAASRDIAKKTESPKERRQS
jgi:hypothetical protein